MAEESIRTVSRAMDEYGMEFTKLKKSAIHKYQCVYIIHIYSHMNVLAGHQEYKHMAGVQDCHPKRCH